MKRLIVLILLSISLLLVPGHSIADATPKVTEDYLIEAVRQDYPDWLVWHSTCYGSGTWEGELALHTDINLYRVSNDQIELKELSALMNPLHEGDSIPWESTDWAPVPIASGTAELLQSMDSKELFDDGAGANFKEEALPYLAPFMLTDEQFIALLSYSECLVAVTKDSTDQYRLKIAEWDGTKFSTVISTPGQSESITINSIHSWNHDLEIYCGNELEVHIHRGDDGLWRLLSINNGWSIIAVYSDSVVDVTWGGVEQNNDFVHYGKPLFNTVLTGIDYSSLSSTLEEAIQMMDQSGFACTARDGTEMYDMPNGKVIATCYTRVPGVILSEQDEWVQLCIGSESDGVIGWFHMADLAFDSATEQVICTFPSFDDFYDEEDGIHIGFTLVGSEIVLSSEDNLWLIGQNQDGHWLVLVDHYTVCTAPADTFTGIGPTVHEDCIGDSNAP